MPVNTQHRQYSAMADRWKRCRDVYEGQDAIHAAGTAYLPKLKDQKDADYTSYVQRTPFHNATYRTISGLKGMIFRVDPQMEVAETVKEMLKDVTMSGVPMETFAQTVVEEVLNVGRVGVFVDYPNANPSATQADAQAQNLRPKMVLYRAESIINWKTGFVKNKTVLTQVVLEECVEVQDVDEFTVKSIKRWRVLDLIGNVYRVRMFERQGDRDVQIGEDIFPTMGGATMDYIPFVFIGPDDLTPEVDVPPLIDLVNMNLSHYRSSADFEHGAHFTGLPTVVVKGHKMGDPNEKLYIGSSEAWVFPSKDADAKYLEFTGQGLEPLAKVIEHKEAQMAILGARMLEPQHKGVEAAETLGIRRVGEESMLGALAHTVSEGLKIALQWFSDWAMAGAEVEYSLNDNFYPARMTAQELAALVAAWQQGAISQQTLFDNLQAAGIIDDDTTLEDEQARIGDQPPVLSSMLLTGVDGRQPPGKGVPPKKGAKPEEDEE